MQPCRAYQVHIVRGCVSASESREVEARAPAPPACVPNRWRVRACVCLRVSYKVWQKHLVALRCITPTAIVGPHNTFQSDVFFLRLSGPFSICLLVPSHDIMMYVTHQKGSSIWRDAFGKLTFSEAYTIHIDILTYYIWYIHNTYNTYIVMWCIYLPHYSYTKCSKTGPGPSRGSQNNSFIRFVFCC